MSTLQCAEKNLEHNPKTLTLTLDQMAVFYGVCTRTLRNYIKSGRLKACKVGRSYRITMASLEEFLESVDRPGSP